MTRPQKDAVAHLDWVLTCSRATGGRRCTQPATHLVEIHQPGQCTHPALNSFGNLEKLVCPDHLRALVVDAERTARRYQPLPFWLRWFRDDPEQRCPSCRKTICHAVDILQVVKELPKGRTA